MKANTVIAFGGAPTTALTSSTQPGQPLYGITFAHYSKPLLFLPGGVPLQIGELTIGALGIGGALPGQDAEVAMEAAAALATGLP